MKTKEELNALKEEVETLNTKLHELTEDELKEVTGGGLIHARQNEEVNPETDYCAYFEPKGGKNERLCKNCAHLDVRNSECFLGPR